MTFSTYHLQVKARTWSRDSFGLFDYETNKYTSQTLSISSGGKIARENNQILYRKPSAHLKESQTREENQESAEEPLISVADSPQGIRISSESQKPEGPHQFWIVIDQEDSNDGYSLKANDIIRFGRVVFRVKQLKIVNKAHSNKKSIIESLRGQMNMLQAPFMISSVTEQSLRGSTLGEKACKICLSEKSDEQDDPLISPCKCIGSVKYVHLKCMQRWVMSKLNTQENKNIITIFWKNLDCELCKERLPLNLVHHGKEFSLIPFDSKMSGSYIMMESFSKEKNSTGIHLVDLSSNEQFRIGRGHDCDLKIVDISVSRIHAMLIVKKGKIFLKDSQSKFGTLILRKEPIILNSRVTKSPWLQWGRTFMRFTLKKQWLAYLSCVRCAIQTNEIENTGPQIEIKQAHKKREKQEDDDESLIRLDYE